MSVAGEVTDASIMEVGRSRPQFQYSRVNIILQVLEFLKMICRILLLAIYMSFMFFQEDLMLIKNLRLSRRRPTFLDVAYNK